MREVKDESISCKTRLVHRRQQRHRIVRLRTYDKAYEKFKELIANEMNPDNSWVGELEWENGVPKDDKIELDFLDRRNDTDETECYWMITDTWDYGVRTYISIEIKEVL